MFFKFLCFILTLLFNSECKKTFKDIIKRKKEKIYLEKFPLKLDPDYSKSLEEIVTSRGYIKF